jgi:succinate dehydrogenase/fumarate reductase flavoprotein subunit
MAAASGVAATGAAVSLAATPQVQRPIKWAREVDVVVVGSGAAALSAAIAATRAGASVVLLEKGPTAGGTTAKRDAINFMVRGAYPVLYREDQPRFGVGEREYALIEAFYDQSGPILEDLEKIGALKTVMTDMPIRSYEDHLPQDKAPYGRVLFTFSETGIYEQGRLGSQLVRMLRAWLDSHQVPILIRHRVIGLERNSIGEVIGVAADTPEGPIFVRARKGVVFGSGGYTHNPEMMLNYQPGPIWGGCAVPTNQGDLINIAIDNGAKLGNMVNAWRAQIVLEQALEAASVPRDVFQAPAMGMIMVNRIGHRVVNEMRCYPERTRAHFVWDATESEYPNRFLFMVYDQKCADLLAGYYPLPARGDSASYVISAPTLQALADAIQQRLNGLASRIGKNLLSANFAAELDAQIRRFNDGAEKGVDPEFDRGKYEYDKGVAEIFLGILHKDTKWTASAPVNPALYPIETAGPFYAMILAAGTLDTNGGPVTDNLARVLDTKDKPIPRLYAAGNCMSSASASCYWGAGSTLGPAITFGTIAGRHAAGLVEEKG